MAIKEICAYYSTDERVAFIAFNIFTFIYHYKTKLKPVSLTCKSHSFKTAKIKKIRKF